MRTSELQEQLVGGLFCCGGFGGWLAVDLAIMLRTIINVALSTLH